MTIGIIEITVKHVGHLCFPIKSIIANMRYIFPGMVNIYENVSDTCIPKCDSCFTAQSCFCISGEGIASKLTLSNADMTHALYDVQMSLQAHGCELTGPVSLPLQNTVWNPSRKPYNSRTGPARVPCGNFPDYH